MAKVSIYVSDELRARMAEVGDQINWSDIARPAFDQAIQETHNRKGQKMSAIERLKESKKSYFEHVEKGGEKAGRKWAADVATYYELRAVAEIDMLDHLADKSGILSEMYAKIDPDRTMNFDVFLECIFKNENVSPEWAYYFAWGAQQFYDEVKDQI